MQATDTPRPSANYTFWLPPAGRTVQTGAESEQVELPQIPLPVLNSDLEGGQPSDTAIGSGVYDYLRQFPDCQHNHDYAVLLRDIWPHYLADLASQTIMLDHKVVDAPYIQRKLASLRILLLLSPDNPGLLLQLGLTCNELAMMFTELGSCRKNLLQALNYFSRVQELQPNEAASLNGLAQIDYLLGDYPSALQRWQRVFELVQDPSVSAAIAARIEHLQQTQPPERPLVSDLEDIGEAMRLLVSHGEQEANAILERLFASGLADEFPNPEFYTLLASSRERTGDSDGARAAYIQALELDPEFQRASEELERLIAKG